MSEERRAIPVAIPIEIAVDEAEADAEPTPSSRLPPAAGSTAPVRDAARRRLALRIPDDEVARPSGATPEVRARVAPALPSADPRDAEPLTPMRIITISEPPPPVVGQTSEARHDAWSEDSSRVPPAPDTPVVPLPPDTPLVPLPADTPRVALPLDGEGEEEVDVRFDDEPPTPALPRAVPVELLAPPDQGESPANQPAGLSPSAEARAEPGHDALEVAAEDVVTVEPPPTRAATVLPPMRPKLASQPPAPPFTRRPGESVPVPRPSLVIVPPHVGSMPSSSAEATAQRRKARLWWEELFNDDYIRTAEKVGDDAIVREVAFIEESLGVERGGALLDLACGTGRHATELSRRGYEVVGFDLSLAMLARAGEDAQDRGAKLNFVQGDMREMAFDEQFDGVYCWNTSFGYFEEDKNAQVIDRVRRSLKAGGQFLLDVVNRDFIIQQSPSLAWFEGDGCVCMDEMSVDFITSRLKVKRTMMLDDGRSREIEYSMRVYSLHELGKILHEHGFKVREVSGRLATPGVFFGNESPRAIILAEKHA